MQCSFLAGVSTPASSYDKAFHRAQETGKPLVVLVGADWCPGCRTMKQSVLPQMEKRGSLGKVSFAVVNSEVQAPLAEKLMQGQSIPQLVMYTKTATGWDRRQLTGAHSVSEVEAFISQGSQRSMLTVGQRK